MHMEMNHRHMKKNLLLSLWLTLLDQTVKLVIANFYMDRSFPILNGVISFQPKQNTNLSWISGMFDYRLPIILLIQMVTVLLFWMVYRYLSYGFGAVKRSMNIMIACVVGGAFCSFMDVVFWGGSLDFIRLFDWFIFDLKDVYLTISEVFIVGLVLGLYLKLSKAERKEKDFFIWIKKGCPGRNSPKQSAST